MSAFTFYLLQHHMSYNFWKHPFSTGEREKCKYYLSIIFKIILALKTP